MNKFAPVKESFTWSSGRPAAEVDMGTSLQLLSLLTEAMQKNPQKQVGFWGSQERVESSRREVVWCTGRQGPVVP